MEGQQVGGPIYPDLDLSISQRAFLMVFRQVGSIERAVRLCKLSSRAHYYWLRESKNKEHYQDGFRRANEDAAQILEDEAFKRAVHGELDPVFYKGKIVGYRTVKSDTMLTVLLKARKPEVFADRSKVEHSGGFTIHDMDAEIDRREKLRATETPAD